MGEVGLRFWSKVQRGPDCWEWQRAVQKNGYGRFRMPDGHIGAHVMAYILSKGPVPEGKEVHHRCENRRCVRPSHLQALTHRENLLASNTVSGINARKTHCSRSHPFDEKNTRTHSGKRVCLACRRERYRERAGDIGVPKREIELEPLTAPPITEPVTPTPAPVREPEKVPA